MQYQQETLNNGLNTLFINSPGSTAASVQIWFRAGSALENKKNEGIAHFLEHMFFKGTPTRPGAAIAHEVESFGGEINAFTSFDYTCYYINCPNSKLNKTISILMDMISNPKFKTEELLPERGVVFEEYRRSQDNPNQYAFQKLQAQAFTSGYAHPILGNQNTIKNFSREQLIEFRNNNYNLTNSLLVVSGDLSKKEQYVKCIETFKLPFGPETKFPEFKLKNKSTLKIHEKDVRMATMTICLQAPKYNQEAASFEELTLNCLGHGQTSPIYQGLVLNNSIATSTSVSTMYMNSGGVHFLRLVYPCANQKQVLKTFKQIIEKACNIGFPGQEIEKIKNQYIAAKTYEKESLESFSFSLGHGFAQNGNPHCDEEFLAQIKSTSTKQVNSSLQEIFTRPFHISLQVPKGEMSQKMQKEVENFKESMNALSLKFKKQKNKLQKKDDFQFSKFDPQLKYLKLKNGIRLLYRKNTMTPTYVLHSYIKGGVTDENNQTNGAYSLLTSVLTKGHHKLSYEQIAQELERTSTSLNGFSGKNAYGLTMHGQSEFFKMGLKHFMGALIYPDMPMKYIKHEKEQSLRSLDSQTEDPVKQCFKIVNAQMFPKHPYSLNSLGTPKTIKNISRRLLHELHASNLKNKEILLTYCGDKELSEIKELLEKELKHLAPRNEKKTKGKKYTSLKNQQKHLFFDREQTQIFIGIPTGPFDSKENLFLKILTTHLSGQSSELFVEVRDRQGLCYTAQPIHFTGLEGGFFGIYMASGHDKVDAAINALEKILERTKLKGLNKKDFIRVKKMIEGQTELNLQTNDDYANVYSIPALHGYGHEFFYQTQQKIKSMSYDDFQKGIKRILSRQWNKTIVGRKLK